jgi:hypothetical protein
MRMRMSSGLDGHTLTSRRRARFDLAQFLPLTLLCLTACATVPPADGIDPLQTPRGPADVQLQRSFIRQPVPAKFSLCHTGTCSAISTVHLTAGQWQTVRERFRGVADARQERAAVQSAVARLEELTGDIVGTNRDLGRNVAGFGESGQMDCVDEATNTSVYLMMMADDGLLRFHDIGARISRGVLTLQAPHFTATLSERGSGARYAVDSWFLDNGAPPFIVPLDDWRAGWEPD